MLMPISSVGVQESRFAGERGTAEDILKGHIRACKTVYGVLYGLLGKGLNICLDGLLVFLDATELFKYPALKRFTTLAVTHGEGNAEGNPLS